MEQVAILSELKSLLASNLPHSTNDTKRIINLIDIVLKDHRTPNISKKALAEDYRPVFEKSLSKSHIEGDVHFMLEGLIKIVEKIQR